VKAVLVAALAALFVAIMGGTLTEIGPWYLSLQEPSWKPPDYAFGPIWTAILAMAAASGAIAWRANTTPRFHQQIIALFALNGALNILWSLLFFKLHRPDWALYEVGFFWLSILALILALFRHSRRASLLLLPYLLWVTIASKLNDVVVTLNGPFGG
jgi:tryptophan-rich sensory protein